MTIEMEIPPHIDAEEVEKKAQEQVDQSKAEKAQKSCLTSATELLDKYVGKLKSGSLPQLYELGDALDGIEVGGGLITLLGAPPGSGKTALSSQVMFEAMERKNDLVCYLANAEMSFDCIIRRELTRLTRIKSDAIRFGVLSDDDMLSIDFALSGLRASMERIHVIEELSIGARNGTSYLRLKRYQLERESLVQLKWYCLT